MIGVSRSTRRRAARVTGGLGDESAGVAIHLEGWAATPAFFAVAGCTVMMTQSDD